MGLISSLLSLGLVAGASITAYQASEKTKKEKGKHKKDAFIKNFSELAVKNSKLVIDFLKGKLDGKAGEYRYSDKGENGYTYPDAKGSASGDKVNEVFETMKEKAPEVIGKVQNFVEDVREHAPEYKEKAQAFVGDVVDAAKKAMDDKPVDVKEDKPEEKPEEKPEDKPGEKKEG